MNQRTQKQPQIALNERKYETQNRCELGIKKDDKNIRSQKNEQQQYKYLHEDIIPKLNKMTSMETDFINASINTQGILQKQNINMNKCQQQYFSGGNQNFMGEFTLGDVVQTGKFDHLLRKAYKQQKIQQKDKEEQIKLKNLNQQNKMEKQIELNKQQQQKKQMQQQKELEHKQPIYNELQNKTAENQFKRENIFKNQLSTSLNKNEKGSPLFYPMIILVMGILMFNMI